MRVSFQSKSLPFQKTRVSHRRRHTCQKNSARKNKNRVKVTAWNLSRISSSDVEFCPVLFSRSTWRPGDRIFHKRPETGSRTGRTTQVSLHSWTGLALKTHHQLSEAFVVIPPGSADEDEFGSSFWQLTSSRSTRFDTRWVWVRHNRRRTSRKRSTISEDEELSLRRFRRNDSWGDRREVGSSTSRNSTNRLTSSEPPGRTEDSHRWDTLEDTHVSPGPVLGPTGPIGD